jgi:hypothetical protein
VISLLGALALQATVAVAAPAKPSLYAIEAYLDRAPQGVQVIDSIRIGRAGRSRVLLIVAAKPGSDEATGTVQKIFGDAAADSTALQVNGRTDRVSQLMEMQAGKKLTGTIVYRPGARAFVIRQLNS